MSKLPSKSTLVLEDRVQGGAADLRGPCDSGLRGAGLVRSLGLLGDLGHRVCCFLSGTGALGSRVFDAGEVDVFAVHAGSVKHLTAGGKERKVLYMETTKTYSAIYVTMTKNGKPRYSHFSGRQMRLFPVTRQVAEASFAAGATIYRKQAGTSIWAEGGCEVIS